MSYTEFQEVPSLHFLVRALSASVGGFILGFLLLGAGLVFPTHFSAGPSAEQSIFQAAAGQISGASDEYKQVTYECAKERIVNDVQQARCKERQRQMAVDLGTASVPFVLAVFFVIFSRQAVRRVFRYADGEVRSGKAVSRGTVTDPAEARNDIFGWFFCMRSLSVELADRKQLRVYTPSSAPVPSPGSRYAVYGGRRLFGSRRYFGAIYAPHMAVVKGG